MIGIESLVFHLLSRVLVFVATTVPPIVEGAPARTLAQPQVVNATPRSAARPAPASIRRISGPERQRLRQLKASLRREISRLRGLRVSVQVKDLRRNETLYSHRASARRVLASNAKLFTTAAAAKRFPPNYGFKTEVSRRGRTFYLRGTGDPLLQRSEVKALARQVRATGIRTVRMLVVDDTHFSRRRMAPGFNAFGSSRFRPMSSALNINGNMLTVRVLPARRGRRPIVQVEPASGYVRIRNRLRHRRRSRRRRIAMSRHLHRGRLVLSFSGTVGRRARAYVRRIPIPDPALATAWVVRHELAQQGVHVRFHSPGQAASARNVTRSCEKNTG